MPASLAHFVQNTTVIYTVPDFLP